MSEIATGDSRQRHMTVLLGTNGMGKTKLMEQFIEKWKRSNPNGGVFAIHDAGKYNGYWPDDYKNEKKLLYEYVEKVTNYGRGPLARVNGKLPPLVGTNGGLLILDDMDGWCPQNTDGTIMNKLFTKHRHQFLDVLITGHRTQQISKVAIGCCHYLYLFNTNEPHCIDYLMKIEGMREAKLQGMAMPKGVGECIEIIKDPLNPSTARATFRNFYDPRLAQKPR
jgi:hypothetical protein